MKHVLNRREFLASTLVTTLALPMAGRPSFAAAMIPPGPTFGFSLYGMKSLPFAEAIRTCAEIGYDDVELALLPGYPTEPSRFGKEARRTARDLLKKSQLSVPCLMENLVAVTSEAEHQKNLDRIARAAELGCDLAADRPPFLETVLGGKPADWPAVRESMTERLRDWAETARKHGLILAVKPHVGGAVHTPAAALQLFADVGSPHLKLVYDFSHYQVQGLALDATLKELVSQSNLAVFVHVKDGRRVDGKVQFLLPGEGDTDYAALLRGLVDEQLYRGSITVEVSGQIFSRPDYNPRVAAERSFRTLADAWKKAGLPPRKRTD